MCVLQYFTVFANGALTSSGLWANISALDLFVIVDIIIIIIIIMKEFIVRLLQCGHEHSRPPALHCQ